ncbi:MAG TPA: autotransporter-associated beta strand repeat-containing protein [Verrucomicrobiae bacterium]|nr:autotransporter-associated beta strand repeat-containing protein [Verrucomicrobiae bacterium]
MKTSNIAQTWSKKTSVPSHQPVGLQRLGWLLLCAAGLSGALTVRAASDTWTNAPVDNTWANTNNWVGRVVPGALNQTGNSVNNDVATFNTPIFGTIGGAANPILPDNGTINGDRSRALGSIIFDTANCGAYVFYSPSPAVLPTTTNAETGILNLCHNGSVTINAAVTNSQTFLVPIRIRLPSSTWGTYNFVNNATDPSVVLNLNTVTNDSANTRSTTFYLGGSNTGTNSIGCLSRGTTTSATAIEGIVKQGTGTWILLGTNDFSGSGAVMSVNGGLLIVKDPGAFGAVAAATVNSNGTLEIDGVTLSQSRLNLLGQGSIRVNGSATVNGVSVGTATGISGTLATTSSGDVMTVLTNSGGLLNDTVVHVSGPGTVLLTNIGTYAGSWSVDAGTLQIATSSALGTGENVNVSPGAMFDVTPLGTGVTWNPTTVGIGGSGTGTTVGSTAAAIKADAAGTIDLATGAKNINLTFTPASTNGDASHPALYIAQGTLKLGDNVFTVNNASGTPLGVGTYTLITQASGNVTDGGGYSVVVTGSGLASDVVGTIQVSGGNVNLVTVFHVPQPLIWQGGNPNATWDNGTTANWLDGATLTVFYSSDNVTFNSVGSANSTVTLSGGLAPGSVTVDTSANDYTFSGSGSIAGTTALTKISAGTLTLSTVNSYLGGTVISNGVVKVGVNNAVPDGASGDVSVYGTLDLNALNDTINGLNGTGTVDDTAGGASVLTVGNNNDSGTFSGTVQNTAGSLGLTKAGTGTQTLSGANTYSGPTVINAGTLRAGNLNAFANSPVTINAGALDLGTSLVVSNLSGAVAGTIVNNSSATPVTLFSHGVGSVTSLIADGSGGGAVSIQVLDGSLTLSGANTYSGGTYVASGAVLAIGVRNPGGSGQAGSGGIIASNNATLTMPTAVSTAAGPLNSITTVDGATVTFASAETANSWAGQFIGSATATNIFVNGNATISGAMSFSNFLGTVIITNGEVRIYRQGTPPAAGGDNTSFVFLNGGGMFTRENEIVHLGSLSGNGVITAPGGGSPLLGTYMIGGKNVNCDFAGGISGTNNIVKIGTGTLMLNGGGQYITNVTSPDGGLTFVTNVGYGTNMLLYIGATTVSNGVLALAAPSELTSSTPVTLAGSSAVLDASAMGYISNQVTTDGNGNTVTNQFPVTNSIFEVVSGQTLQGMGTLNGYLLADAGSSFNVGLPVGSFTVTSNAELAGAVTMDVNATNTPNCSELMAPGFTIDSTASLVVTNLGPEQAATFQLFNHPVNFSSVTLPTLSGTNSWINNLTVNGSITMVAPAPVPPTPDITSIGLSGTTLTITATNGAANGTFVLLESTNLAAPLTNWVPVLTNTFDASGNLNLSTNVVNRAVPQEFFILLQ